MDVIKYCIVLRAIPISRTDIGIPTYMYVWRTYENHSVKIVAKKEQYKINILYPDSATEHCGHWMFQLQKATCVILVKKCIRDFL